ncbi:MAG TPA: T9SS type A sorting domain-containing protein, partial [Bacteroidetes bacterium]|nr:T9SS type A sorting domain-containing protein [Bacteroidota bacterium]
FFCLLFIFTYLGHANLCAQITINENIITNDLGKVIREVLYETNTGINSQLADIINAVGADQTWDFSGLNYVDSTVIFEELMTVAPDDPYIGDPNLAGSTFVLKETLLPVQGGLPDTTIQFRYFTLEGGAWVAKGSVTMFDIDGDGMVDEFLQWFSPPTLQVQFPVTFGSEWHDSTSLMQEFNGMVFTSSIMLDSNWVDGWGTLTTPTGSAPALRVRDKTIDRMPGSPISDVGNSLDFQSADGSQSASIVIEDGRAFYRARTVVDGTTPTFDLPKFSFRLQQNYPNPFSESTTILFSLEKPQRVQMRIIGLKGNVHKMFADKYYAAGQHELLWTNTHLPTGVYILEMRVGNQVQQRMMDVLR